MQEIPYAHRDISLIYFLRVDESLLEEEKKGEGAWQNQTK